MFCEKEHPTVNCTTYGTVTQRKERLKELGRCTTCARRAHEDGCVDLKCIYCTEPHHSWLHGPHPTLGTSNTTVVKHVQLKASQMVDTRSQVLPLATMQLRLTNGKTTPVRVLLDQCAQGSFIDGRLVRENNLKIVGVNKTTLVGVFHTERSPHDIVQIKLRLGRRFANIQATVVEDLNTGFFAHGLQKVAEELKARGVKLADPYSSDQIDDVCIILGADHYYQFVRNITMRHGIALLNTAGGMVISGPIDGNATSPRETVVCRIGVVNPTDLPDLYEENTEPAHKLWDLDTIGIGNNEMEQDENTAREEYLKTTSYDKGQYRVRLPFKESLPELPSNRGNAFDQLKSNLRNLQTKPE